MKTRILTTALMILFSTVVIAEPVRNTNEDSLSIHQLAVLNGSTAAETIDCGTISEYLTLPSIIENNAGLEGWVESREVWESEASDATFAYVMEPVMLGGWYDSRESWEQESSSLDLSGVVYINNLEEWVSECEMWEQEDAAGVMVSLWEGSFQQDWINNRAMWEQK